MSRDTWTLSQKWLAERSKTDSICLGGAGLGWCSFTCDIRGDRSSTETGLRIWGFQYLLLSVDQNVRTLSIELIPGIPFTVFLFTFAVLLTSARSDVTSSTENQQLGDSYPDRPLTQACEAGQPGSQSWTRRAGPPPRPASTGETRRWHST